MPPCRAPVAWLLHLDGIASPRERSKAPRGSLEPTERRPRPAQLVLEVVNQLQKMFNPDMHMIKKRIEDLI